MKSYPFAVEIKHTRRKNSIAIRVENAQLKVLAPKNAKTADIEKLIDKNFDWINAKLKTAQANIYKEYKAGEIWDFFNKEQILSIEISEKSSVNLDLEQGKFVIFLTEKMQNSKNSEQKIRNLVKVFIQENLQSLCLELAQKYAWRLGLSFEKVSIKNYKSMWGMCKANNLYFNAGLIFAPKWVIEYVVVHEVCHLRHKHHQKAFWLEVENLYPQYKAARQWLKIKGENLLFRKL